MTATFAGAPALGFTVYGAAPQRDAAILGLAADTSIAEAWRLYLRYDGEVGTGVDNHVFSAGLRMSWSAIGRHAWRGVSGSSRAPEKVRESTAITLAKPLAIRAGTPRWVTER